MRIQSFKVERYRSIKIAEVSLSPSLTVLVGANNEGKSNVLRALAIGAAALSAPESRPHLPRVSRMRARYEPLRYEWERDFPLGLRDKGDQTTIMEFRFIRESDAYPDVCGDLQERRIGAAYPQDIVTARVIFSPANRPRIDIQQGKERPSHLPMVTYIPSVRTADQAEDVVNLLVAGELATLEDDYEYQQALAIIERVQAPVLSGIRSNLTETLSQFLPNIAEITVDISRVRRVEALSHSVEISVDDGHKTALRDKGDGIQSLAALALLRKSAQDRRKTAPMILAVEEPEAHLHPRAIREVKRVLGEIASAQQVVITTHSPILVDPLHLSSNIIVDQGKAASAAKIEDIRNCLGVSVQDNLISAHLAVLVEGHTDQRIIQVLLRSDAKLETALQQRRLVVERLGGVQGLANRLAQYANGVCASLVFLDGDGEALRAIQRAKDMGLLSDDACVMAAVDHKGEAEIEDLIDPDLYLPRVNAHFCINIRREALVRSSQCWSKTMKMLLKQAGKQHDNGAMRDVKTMVADAVESAGPHVLQGVEPLATLLRTVSLRFDLGES